MYSNYCIVKPVISLTLRVKEQQPFFHKKLSIVLSRFSKFHTNGWIPNIGRQFGWQILESERLKLIKLKRYWTATIIVFYIGKLTHTIFNWLTSAFNQFSIGLKQTKINKNLFTPLNQIN